MTRMLRLTPAVIALAALLGACGKKGDTASQTSGGTIAPPPVGSPATPALQVTDVALGRRLGADKRVTDETDDFRPRDTVYASVHTTGASDRATITARWTFQNGQQVDERTETISPTGGDTFTEFHVAKRSGWPEGKYTLHVLLNGSEVQTKEFTVKK